MRSYENIKSKSCITLKDLEELSTLDHRLKVTHEHISPLIYKITCRVDIPYLKYMLHEETNTKLRLKKGILPYEYMPNIKRQISTLLDTANEMSIYINQLHELCKYPYVKSILPYSQRAIEECDLHSLKFIIKYEDHIHNEYIKEPIGSTEYYLKQINPDLLNSEYQNLRSEAINSLNNEILTQTLKNCSSYQNAINDLKETCSSIHNMQIEIRISDDYQRITLINYYIEVFTLTLSQKDRFDIIGQKIKDTFLPLIEDCIKSRRDLENYINLINGCKNGLWKMEQDEHHCIQLLLFADNQMIAKTHINITDTKNIKNDIHHEMKELLQYAEYFKEIRFMEVN